MEITDIDKNKEVEYCEWLAFGNPIQRIMKFEEAKKRYESKVKALRNNTIIGEMSFIGIKDKSSNDWIIKMG